MWTWGSRLCNVKMTLVRTHYLSASRLFVGIHECVNPRICWVYVSNWWQSLRTFSRHICMGTSFIHTQDSLHYTSLNAVTRTRLHLWTFVSTMTNLWVRWNVGNSTVFFPRRTWLISTIYEWNRVSQKTLDAGEMLIELLWHS